MYIKNVSVKNYRNFGNTAFEIELKPFTLILGENNIGKTNLLDALGLIFSQEIIVFKKRILEIDDFNYETVQQFKKSVVDTKVKPVNVSFPEVQIDVVLTGMTTEQKAVVGDWSIKKDLSEAKITYLFAPRTNFDTIEWIKKQRDLLKQAEKISIDDQIRFIDFPIENYRYFLFGGDDPSKECELYFLRMLKMEFLDALRDAQKELTAGSDYRLLYRILRQRDETYYSDIKAILSNLENAIRTNSNLANIKQEVAVLLDKVSLQTEGMNNSIDFNFSSPEAAEILKKISMIYGTNPIDVARNGLGRNNLLYISLILSHLTTSGITGSDTKFRLIAIEEPEAHLH